MNQYLAEGSVVQGLSGAEGQAWSPSADSSQIAGGNETIWNLGCSQQGPPLEWASPCGLSPRVAVLALSWWQRPAQEFQAFERCGPAACRRQTLAG